MDKVGTGTTDQQPSPISVLETSFASDFADLSSISDFSASLPPRKSTFLQCIFFFVIMKNTHNFRSTVFNFNLQ